MSVLMKKPNLTGRTITKPTVLPDLVNCCVPKHILMDNADMTDGKGSGSFACPCDI